MYTELASMDGEGGPAWLVNFHDFDDELRFLRQMVNRFRAEPVIRNLAVSIIKDAGVEARNKPAQARAIARWVQQNVYYVHELPERFQTPTETLRLKAGDCDDFTSLICSLCEAIGIPCAFVVMEINGRWAHIFPAARGQRGLIALDATMRSPVGEQNPVKLSVSLGKQVRLKVY